MQDRLRALLQARAREGRFATYKELADALGLEPPHTIHRLTRALEALMRDDVAAHRPLLAALCVSRQGHGLPARGFFEVARALGAFTGDAEGPEAREFHARESRRAMDFHGRRADGSGAP
ncbi:MAG: hypothetical protein CMLOHMNK_03478 [Steroidobacteraceae bacterium]|nr:hypothetical protein [Steroidobacteraceae bacterium]